MASVASSTTEYAGKQLDEDTLPDYSTAVAAYARSSDSLVPANGRRAPSPFRKVLKRTIWPSASDISCPRWRRGRKISVVVLSVLVMVGMLAFLTWLPLVLTLIARLKPHTPNNGLSRIVAEWKEPGTAGANETVFWYEDFSRDITPHPMHSHNDYRRRVPLFDALLAGATSVEADIWVTNSPGELLVGHHPRALRPQRTLKSLYLDPLTAILAAQNEMYPPPQSAVPSSNSSSDSDFVSDSTSANASLSPGVFDTDPKQSLVLLLDVKTDGNETWPAIMAHLAPLRQKGWLTRWDGSTLVPGPITVVGSGNTPFDRVLGMANGTETDRFVFFDAPLGLLDADEAGVFNSSNSLYASVNWGRNDDDNTSSNPNATIADMISGNHAANSSSRQLRRQGLQLHRPRFTTTTLTPALAATIRSQIATAQSRGLLSRYWGAPSWPIGARDKVWNFLVDAGVGVLNVDDLVGAGGWNWDWCRVAGLWLCGG